MRLPRHPALKSAQKLPPATDVATVQPIKIFVELNDDMATMRRRCVFDLAQSGPSDTQIEDLFCFLLLVERPNSIVSRSYMWLSRVKYGVLGGKKNSR